MWCDLEWESTVRVVLYLLAPCCQLRALQPNQRDQRTAGSRPPNFAPTTCAFRPRSIASDCLVHHHNSISASVRTCFAPNTIRNMETDYYQGRRQQLRRLTLRNGVRSLPFSLPTVPFVYDLWWEIFSRLAFSTGKKQKKMKEMMTNVVALPSETCALRLLFSSSFSPLLVTE